jgi:transglutaminase-like putative cysteine protease
MVLSLLSWFWNRFRPQEGWLPFFLLVAVTACLATAVNEVEWVPETAVVIPAAFGGLVLGGMLAKRPLLPFAAWLLITAYGLLTTTLWLGRLVPPLWRWFAGWQPFSQYLRQNGALFIDRVGSWFTAVFSGGSSRETIIFALGLGLAAWFLAAYVAWSAYRQRQALLALLTMGTALAVNGYYGQASLEWIILFVGLATLLTAVLHLANLEQTWNRNHVDYSDQIRFDLILHASAIGLILLALSMALPGISISKLAEAFQNQPAVQAAEQTLERVFAGVRPPRGPAPGPDSVGGSGLMPRAYLLGNPPELSETVVMTAVVSLPGPRLRGDAPPSLNDPWLNNRHWRALSYNVYTGRGWALSEEREEQLPANARITLPPTAAQQTIQQTVHWIFDERVTRYTLGMPQQFDQPVSVFWRGLTDLSRVQRAPDESSQYQVLSQISTATQAQLRQTGSGEAFNANISPVILARYTSLPASLPPRVGELAQEVAGDEPTAYDQARALELFLRQYPYSLDVELPPENTDPVDFFLFDLQSGYCDYYASAMAVMARTLGLPARVAVGYLAQPADANGVQTIYQINGHSWAEIYFPEYGWIEFEPTAAFPSLHDTMIEGQVEFDENQPPVAPSAIPPPAPQEPVWLRLWRGWRWILLAGALALGYWLWRRQQKQAARRDSVVWAYGRLQHHAHKLGQPLSASQTPDEFTAVFLTHLNGYANNPRLKSLIDRLRPHVERLNSLFVRRRYGREFAGGISAAQKSWQQIRWPLWLLRLINKMPR